MKKWVRLMFLLVIMVMLTACQDELIEFDDGDTMPRAEYVNSYAHRKVLILSRGTEYKSALIDAIVKKTNMHFSLEVDDLTQVYEYNFVEYYRVVLIESVNEDRLPVLKQYLVNYVGRNNLLILPVGDEEIALPKQFTAYVCRPELELIEEQSNDIALLLRKDVFVRK